MKRPDSISIDKVYSVHHFSQKQGRDLVPSQNIQSNLRQPRESSMMNISSPHHNVKQHSSVREGRRDIGLRGERSFIQSIQALQAAL